MTPLTELLTSAQMRRCEQDAIDNGTTTGHALMECAGQAVVRAVFDAWPELETPASGSAVGIEYLDQKEAHVALVLCGPGNNGGDGFVVARRLHELGWAVHVFLLGEGSKLPPDARVNHDRWRELGDVQPLCDTGLDAFVREAEPPALVIDALFGTGLTRPFQYLAWIEGALNKWNGPTQPLIVSVDLPSGLCADSGRPLGFADTDPLTQALRADLTVTFHRAKIGHHAAQGPDACGKVVVADIGLPAPPHRDEIVTLAVAQAQALTKSVRHHKFSHGHALLLTGRAGKTGAARLAARGALRIGAGLVTLGVPGAAQQEVACQITAEMLARVDTAEALSDLLQDARINALCLGPGLGLADHQAALVAAALHSKRPIVLDADALTLLARTPSLMAGLHATCILTPHAGEFARLFPDLAQRLSQPPTAGPAYSKVDATRAAARRAGCVVLFKGADTVIATPQGQCALNSAHYQRAAPWLATAGSGDVLAGFITGLLARNLSAFDAAQSGAWLHVACANSFGPGLISEDLPEALPHVFRNCKLQ